MNITAQDYLNLVDNETQNINYIFKELAVNDWRLGAHCSAIYFDSKEMLKATLKIIKESNHLNSDALLGDSDLIPRLSNIENKTKALYHEMKGGLFMCRWLLKKTAHHYDLIINAIIEHDARVLCIPTTELPIDELMAELNQPKNRAMLEQSIAELKAGEFSSHRLIHE